MAFFRRSSVPAQQLAYPDDYFSAREQFLDAAGRAGCLTDSWLIGAKGPCDETLAIDVAYWGAPSTKHWLLLSSGLHGTEAPFGSAVQVAFLQHLAQQEFYQTGVIFLHSLNPFGYAWTRRANENNVDLNRNFLLPGESYQGAHPLYHHVYRTFDPHRLEKFYESFYLRASWLIAKHSMVALQTSLPVGQYDYPKGLFFGGHAPSQTLELLKENLRLLMPNVVEVTHLDFHTGLGRWADYRLLIDLPASDPDSEWFRAFAPAHAIETASAAHTAYLARGSIGHWMKQVLFPEVRYRYAAAEFGTYRPVRVLRSLVRELQAHYSYAPDHPRYQRAKRLVKQTFVPNSRGWRRTSLQQGLELCQRCLAASNSELVVNSVGR